MPFTRRAGAITAGLALIGTLAGVGVASVGAAPPAPIDVSNDHVTCTTFFGSLKFNPALTLATPNVPTTATVKGTLDGCIDADNSNVKIAASKLAGTIDYPSNSATALEGMATVTGSSFTISWKAASGAAKLVQSTTTLNFSQLFTSTVGLTMSGGPSGSDSNFTDSYGLFQLGHDTAHGGTAVPSVTAGGAFTGGDSGHTSTMDGLSSGSVTALAGPSGILSKAGLKAVSLGIGQMHIG